MHVCVLVCVCASEVFLITLKALQVSDHGGPGWTGTTEFLGLPAPQQPPGREGHLGPQDLPAAGQGCEKRRTEPALHNHCPVSTTCPTAACGTFPVIAVICGSTNTVEGRLERKTQNDSCICSWRGWLFWGGGYFQNRL